MSRRSVGRDTAIHHALRERQLMFVVILGTYESEPHVILTHVGRPFPPGFVATKVIGVDESLHELVDVIEAAFA
jgi:hypothetical protein